MKNFTILVLLFVATSGTAQLTTENEEQQEPVELTKEKQEIEKKKIITLAEQRTIKLQQKLNLSNYVSERFKKLIVKYSIQANKVIQSDIPTNEKTKNLNNIVYFQNSEFKEILTVHQFYKYQSLTQL